MRRTVTVITYALVVVAIGFGSTERLSSQGNPTVRSGPSTNEPRQATPKAEPPAKPREPAQAEPQPRTAGPRTAQPGGPAKAQPRQAEPRRPVPPPRIVPPRYYGPPRAYYFPPIGQHRDFYYHPYFGFYFGPYYGPFYPYPGPYFGPPQWSAAALRLKVKPNTAQVYVNGYYAGDVDDFDGIFQRLYLPAGEHRIEIFLGGYRTFAQPLYLNPGDTREVVHQMVALRPGERSMAPERPKAVPGDASISGSIDPGDRPVSPFGILTLRVEPTDAQVVVDGENWLMTGNTTELVIHVPAGAHVLEVRKEGYQPFKTEIDLTEGSRTGLTVRLTR